MKITQKIDPDDETNVKTTQNVHFKRQSIDQCFPEEMKFEVTYPST